MNRRKTKVLLSNKDGQRLIHFQEKPLAGFNDSLWIDIKNSELFKAIEHLMTTNKVAHNVTQIRFLGQESSLSEFEVIYNIS